jgi:hypothetical protein
MSSREALFLQPSRVAARKLPRGLDQLKAYPDRAVAWVCKTKRDARRYGTNVDEWPIEDPEIICADGDNGYLVLDKSMKNIPHSRKSMDVYLDEKGIVREGSAKVAHRRYPSFDDLLAEHGGVDGLIHDLGGDNPWTEALAWEDSDTFAAMSEEEQEEYLLERYEEELNEIYEIATWEMARWKFPLTIYREVTLDTDIKDLRLENIGIYWSWDITAAEAHWGKETGSTYLLKAQIQEEAVDWERSLLALMNPHTGEEEREITLRQGAEIKLLGYREENRRDGYSRSRRNDSIAWETPPQGKVTAGFKAAFLKAAVNYDELFTQLATLVPTIVPEIKNEINWAKTTFSKSNRVIWYLRYARLVLVDQALTTSSANPQLKKQLEDIKLRWEKELKAKSGVSTVQLPSRTQKHTLEHLFALNYTPIQNYDPKANTVEQVIEELTTLEDKFKTETKSSLTPRNEDTIFIDFKDGWAWWYLPRAACDDESGAMGHCGNGPERNRTDRAIFSLRQAKEGGKKWEPHLTFILHQTAEGQPTGYLGEMKGKGNNKPVQRYHRYITKLLEDNRILGIKGGGYKPENNFHFSDLSAAEQQQIESANPNATFTFESYIDKEGLTIEGISEALGLAEDSFTEEGVSGFVINDWPYMSDFVSAAGDDDTLRLQSCIDGWLGFFSEFYLKEEGIKPDHPTWVAIAKQINTEYPNHNFDLEDESLGVDGGTESSSELRKGLEQAFFLSHGWKFDPPNFTTLMRKSIAWSMESADPHQYSSTLTQLPDEHIYLYVDPYYAVEIIKERELQEEDSTVEFQQPYITAISLEDMDFNSPEDGLDHLARVFHAQGQRPRLLEEHGPDRLFKRPETDEEAERDGIKVSKLKNSIVTNEVLTKKFPGIESDIESLSKWMEGKKFLLSLAIEPVSKFQSSINEMVASYVNFPQDNIRTKRITKGLLSGLPQWPIFVDSQDGSILEGRHRIVANQWAGKITVPVVYVVYNLKSAASGPWHSSSYAKYTELVPVGELVRYREYDRKDPTYWRSQDDKDYLTNLASDIKENGVKEPLILSYSVTTNTAMLTEGNHRLAAAIEAGIDEVPVRGYRRQSAFFNGKGVTPPERNFEDDVWGHEFIPQDFKPSMIGVGKGVQA